MLNRVTATFAELRQQCADFDPQLDEFFDPAQTLAFQSYAPAAATGTLIYISPKPGAKPPSAWMPVLDRFKLAWIGAEDSGNEVHVARRVGLALLARQLNPNKTATSPVLLSGFSGGGRVTSMMLPAYPTLFSGALMICGANPLFTITEQALAQLTSMPMVFLTGTGDFNLEDTQMAIATYQQAGLQRTTLSVVDGLEHALPEPDDFAAALSHLLSVEG